MAKPKKPRAAGITQAIGGLLVGFDEQVFRGTPRVEERYKRRDEVSMAAAEGGKLVVGLPDEAPPADPAPTESNDGAGTDGPKRPPRRPRSPA